MKMKKIVCGFCNGGGKDPFDLLSKHSICQVCGGAGKVEIKEPAVKCVFCKGSGVYPQGNRITCTVCGGKGMVSVKTAIKKCYKCEGTGRASESGLPCLICKGRGVVSGT